jgi:hypothetical protein
MVHCSRMGNLFLKKIKVGYLWVKNPKTSRQM